MRLLILILVGSLLRPPGAYGMSCHCTLSDQHPKCKAATNTEECEAGVDHCLVTLKKIKFGYTQPHILGCWRWNYETSKCPDESGICYPLQNHRDKQYINCCCKGNLCNNVTTLEIAEYPNATDIPTASSTSTERITLSNPLHSIWLPAVLICGILLLCIVMVVFVFLYRGRQLRLLKAHFSGVVSNATTRETMDCSSIYPPIHLAEGEMDHVGSKCQKVEQKAHGRFGQVWLVRVSPDGWDAAAKIFPPQDEHSWETEVDIFRLPGLKHPNILKFIGADKVVRDSMETEFWLVTEYHPLGSIHDYLRANILTWSQLLRIALGIARGLAHLHEELPKPSIAHRDFKSRNVLLRSDLSPCIGDLGLAIKFDTGHCVGDAHLQVGTRRYMAPEVLEGAIQFSRDAFLRIDVYAMGLVLWEVMTCTDLGEGQMAPYQLPFEEDLGHQPSMDQMQGWVAQKRMRPQCREGWLAHTGMTLLWETVQDCWDQDAEARLSAGCVVERLQLLDLDADHPNETTNEAAPRQANGHMTERFPLLDRSNPVQDPALMLTPSKSIGARPLLADCRV